VGSTLTIVGATGPTGIHLARELAGRGAAVRVISRSAGNLDRAFPSLEVERVAADALDKPAITDAIAGSEVVFVPDAMRLVAELVARDEAYGQSWIFPGSGPLSADRAARIAGEHLGRRVKIRSAPVWMLRVLGLFSADIRAFMPMVPHYARPISYDASKLRRVLGDPAVTRYEEAIPATLDWIAADGRP